MYKIAICDDDKRYRKTIREIIEHKNSLPENEIRFYEYESGNELLKHTDILHELVFIDIRMPGLDGNQTALKLRNYNKDAVLIFCSSYFEPTVDSINFGQPFRYIMKDLHDTSLRREIAAIMTEVKRRFLNDYAVTVTSAGKIIRIHVENILYVSRAKRGCEIPVVFTCVLFDCPENYFERLGSIKYAVSQTPQVFLDNQITEMGGRLHISWDVVDELFEACIIDEIFLEFVEDIKRISENNKANSTNDFVTKVWGNILTKEIITKSVVPDLLKNIDLKQIKILDYAQELCPPDVKGQVYVSESEIMNDRNKTYYKILEHPLYGRMADTGIIGVLTHDGYMEFVVPNCETSVETPDKKEDTHEEEIEKPIVKEIMKIWKEVFEIEDISIQDDFYTLGGDSIILMRLVDEMCKTLGCDVTVDDILQSENISDLANRV